VSKTPSRPQPVPALSSSDGPAPRQFFPALESLRGLAILLVVLFHYKGILLGDLTLQPAHNLLWAVVYVGNTGVTLFFVLSGFLLSLPFLETGAIGKPPDIKRYAVSRVLRIVPLYYLAVLFAWMVVGDSHSALRALFFVPIGFGLFPFGVPWWSLTTEVQFYILLPMAALLWSSRIGRWVLLAAFAAWLASFVNYFGQRHWMDSIASLVWRDSLFGRAPCFLAGVVAAVVHRRRRVAGFPAMTAPMRSLPLLATAGLLLLLAWAARLGMPEADLRFPQWHVLESAAWAVIVWSATEEGSAGRAGIVRGIVRDVVRGIHAVFGHLGRISYPLFLVHVPIQVYLLFPYSAAGGLPAQAGVGAAAAAVASALFSWMLAVALHRVIELPCLRWKQRVLSAST